MTRHRSIHIGYERLIGTAAVDVTVRNDLLSNPHATALSFGLTSDDATLVADIQVSDLRSFAATLLPRLYGHDTLAMPARHAAIG